MGTGHSRAYQRNWMEVRREPGEKSLQVPKGKTNPARIKGSGTPEPHRLETLMWLGTLWGTKSPGKAGEDIGYWLAWLLKEGMSCWVMVRRGLRKGKELYFSDLKY